MAQINADLMLEKKAVSNEAAFFVVKMRMVEYYWVGKTETGRGGCE